MIHVVAGAVIRADGRVLIAQRPPGKLLAGGWEFPGGKLEAGESRTSGLERELREELDIEVESPRPLMRVRHRYSYGEVLLDLWVVTRYRGEPRGLDGQALRWLSQEQLEASAELLPADRPFVRALRLPAELTAASTPHYVVGSSEGSQTTSKLRGAPCATADEAMRAVVLGSVDFIVIGARLPGGELERLCAAVTVPVFACADSVEWAWRRGATGINLLATPSHPASLSRPDSC